MYSFLKRPVPATFVHIYAVLFIHSSRFRSLWFRPSFVQIFFFLNRGFAFVIICILFITVRFPYPNNWAYDLQIPCWLILKGCLWPYFCPSDNVLNLGSCLGCLPQPDPCCHTICQLGEVGILGSKLLSDLEEREHAQWDDEMIQPTPKTDVIYEIPLTVSCSDTDK